MPDNVFHLVFLVPLMPFAGALIQALIGKRVVKALGPAKGKWLMGLIAFLPIVLAFLLGVALTGALSGLEPDKRQVVESYGSWIRVSGLDVPFEALVDPLSLTMTLIITGVGALIHLYATGYMAEEREYTRFFTYMNLFVGFMLTLVLGANLALLFVGWEGVGLCSYLLIGFWYKSHDNARAANKAFIVNRIGDWGMSLGIFLLAALIAVGSAGAKNDPRLLSYDVIEASAAHVLGAAPALAAIVALLFFVGACGKSAQFPLYLWLPDAMAGPTPVSALIHAATMVTAGVFLLNRLHILFELSTIASAVVACVGAFTALFAALVAFGQTDIKKVLAYSTVSQLGYMFIACGAGVYYAGIFHVATHAFFKALLFLGAGAVIHAMAHNQDLRNYGNLYKYLKITCVTMIAAYVAIAGFPWCAGFFSKEAIIGGAMAMHTAVVGGVDYGNVAAWVGLFAAMLTAWYMTRMTMLTFFPGKERWRLEAEHHLAHHEDHLELAHCAHHAHGEDPFRFYFTDEEVAARAEPEEHHHALTKDHNPHEVSISMWFPLAVLGVLSVFGGWLLERNELLLNWLYPEGRLPILGPMEFHPEGVPVMALSLTAAGAGVFFGLLTYLRGLPAKEGWDVKKWNPFRRAAGAQFGYDAAMMAASVEGGADIAKATWIGLDAGLIDGIVNGAGWLPRQIGALFRKAQTGFVRSYALVMLLGAFAVICYFVYELHGLWGMGQ